MSNSINDKSTEAYWSNRYKTQQTGWDIGNVSTPLSSYINQLKNKETKILIPGAGNAYEAEQLFQLGFNHTFIIDIAKAPLENFGQRVPEFPPDQIILGDFFEHSGQYDLILEQTFFCSFPPTSENRGAYAKKMYELLSPKGKLVGLWFNIPLTEDMEARPFGGDLQEYKSYFEPYFEIKIFDPCYNSIVPRKSNELFAIMCKKHITTLRSVNE